MKIVATPLFISVFSKRSFVLVALGIFLLVASGHAVESVLWQQFKQAKLSATEPTLPDFSYAGYDYSETSIPDTSGWAVFDVTTYGAIPDDGGYDDVAIQATIDAAEAAGGGVVLFPPGRFMVSPNNTVGENIFISSSNIVLQGSGSGVGGTEIFKDEMKVQNGRYIFEFKPTSTSESTITTVVSDAPRESYTIEVADSSGLSVGQRIILRSDSVPYATAYYAPQTIDAAWTRIGETTGFYIRELHTIESIDGNSVTFREPLHLPMIINSEPIYVRSYNMISNVGIEGILFKGNWDSYPEDFVHHKDDIHDYAWNAIRFDNVEDGWLRNCEFRDWNQCVYFDGCAAFTVDSIQFTGKKGHASIHTRRSYGILIKDCQDTAGHHHGPGLGYWGCGTVYLRHQMLPEQRIDSHSGSPYANLMDGVTGGHFDGNGGPHESYPHHGKHFVAWNFKIAGGLSSYDFWSSSRNGHTFAMPIFAGLQGDNISMLEGTFAANESPGVAVEPASLFEAQLQFRLGPTVDALPATAISGTSATLNANLVSVGEGATVSGFYWGLADGGTDTAAWEHFEDLGSASVGAVSMVLNDLSPNQTYWYRAWASNSYFEGWAGDSIAFTTTLSVVAPSILNPENFDAIEESITSSTAALIFNTDTLQVSGGVAGSGHLATNKDGSSVAVFSFLDVNLTTPPIISGSIPLVIMSQSGLRLDTEINVDGGNGAHTVHGLAVSGGGNGGDANRVDDSTAGNPTVGQGPGGSLGNASGSEDSTSGGGGFGGAGGDGTSAGGVVYGDPFLSSLIGGSGAGGTRNKGGGAGGGAIGLVAMDALELTSNATVSAEGGNGAGSGAQLTSGGGSGGAILLRGQDVILNGSLDVSGGAGGDARGGQLNGGGGGGGRIAVFYRTSLNTAGFSLNVAGGLDQGTASIAGAGAAGTIYYGLDDDGLADQWLTIETGVTSPTIVEWSVDYDGDGLSALSEYGLGGSASTADLALLPELVQDGSGGYSFSFNRRQSGIDSADYIVETSTSLESDDWLRLTPNEDDTVAHPSLSGFDRVSVSLPEGDGERFIRLRFR
ncbi:MAG: DUF4955 domain-containing protein [Opitutaceae bacterium]